MKLEGNQALLINTLYATNRQLKIALVLLNHLATSVQNSLFQQQINILFASAGYCLPPPNT